jgi:exodeoxyribonuclease VII small subunit
MPDSDIDRLSFEDALHRLESIVRDLETGKVKRDKVYEQGVSLKSHCENMLRQQPRRVRMHNEYRLTFLSRYFYSK